MGCEINPTCENHLHNSFVTKAVLNYEIYSLLMG